MPEMTWGQMKKEAADQGFEKHPTGTYDMKIASAKTVDGKQYKQIQARLVTQTGPNAGKGIITRLVPMKNDGDVNGLFFAQMSALGFGSEWEGWAQLDQLGLEQGLEWLAPQLVNKMAIVEVTHELYNGEMRDNVSSIKKYSGAQVPGAPSAGVPTPPSVPAPAPAAPPAPAPQVPPVPPQPVQAAPGQPVVPAPPAPVTDTPAPF